MPDDNQEGIFEEYFESCYKHGNILNQEQFERSSEEFERDYQSFLPENKEAAILDFGCGIGDFLYFLKKKGYENFYGVDISYQQIDYCKKNITEKAEAVNGLDFLRDKKDSYDAITALDVMEHITKSDIMAFLEVSFDALKENGTFIARIPNMSNPFGTDIRYGDFTHEGGFTNKSLYQVLWIAGYRDINILPPKEIPIRNYRNFVRKQLVKMLHGFIRFSFYIQDYTVPKNLDKTLVVVCKKQGS